MPKQMHIVKRKRGERIFKTSHSFSEPTRWIHKLTKPPNPQEQEMTLIIPPASWIMVFLHLRIRLTLYPIPKWVSRIRGAPTTTASFPFKNAHLERTGLVKPECTYLPLGTNPQVPTWLIEYTQFTRIPPLWLVGCTIGGRVHRKSSTRKVTNPRNPQNN